MRPPRAWVRRRTLRGAPFAESVLAVVPVRSLKGGSLNDQEVRLDDGQLGAEAVFD
jgi:hypothetical protein